VTAVSAPPEREDGLQQPVSTLRGVGPERAEQLGRLGLHSIADLLLHRPRRYEDRRTVCAIRDLTLTANTSVRGQVVASGVKYFARRTKSVAEVILDDGSGRLHCRWWNLPYITRYFAVGEIVWVYGRVLSLKPRTMDHPETEVVEADADLSIHLGRIVPVYPLTEGLPQRWLRGLLWRVVEEWAKAVPDPWSEWLAADTRKLGNAGRRWPTRAEALRLLHFPGELVEAELGRSRLALDEWLELQTALQERRRQLHRKAQALPCGGDNRWMRPFLEQLGLQLTGAQKRVLREIRADLRGTGDPMRRLLQGDVGAGKTLVAACAALMTLESGYGVVLMAPTEILATQHAQNFRRWFAPLGISVVLRTAQVQEEAAQGQPAMVVGTHALLEDGWSMERLGLVIIDEQHKFGVDQRTELLRKGRYPHLLVMTATPIPRTLALTLYGDLEVSILDEFPAGRGRVRTFVRLADRLPKVWEFVRSQLAAGRQAYVVYPLVDGADAPRGRKAVVSEHEHLSKVLAPYRVGLLHGRMKAPDKDRVMAEFRAGTLGVLLATSVIEVGVDVPNASVLVIEGAEQFGLAQLHQLRGRIGRGPHESYCILVAAAETPEAADRLKVMEETSDGFKIAEADLKLRGPGEMLGQNQSGLPALRFGDLTTDGDLIALARRVAARAGGQPAGAG